MTGFDAGEPEHGGQPEIVMRAFPDAPRPVVDLSTGIAPQAYPVRLPDLDALTRLPEYGEERALRAAAAMAYGVGDPDLVVAGPGTQMLMSLLPYLLPKRRVAILGPTYGGHADAWRLAGAVVDEFPAMELLETAITGPDRIFVVCSPNNPDGRRVSPIELERVARACAEHGTWLIVDEAFADFYDDTMARRVPMPGLIVLRSFGKTYGLPGVRLGFLLGPAGLALRARAMLGAWAVGTVAIAAGRQALADRAWLEQMRDETQAQCRRLCTMLADASLPHFGEAGLFVMLRRPDAAALWRFLCERGIVTRAFSDRPHDLRLGLPRDEGEWSRLESALSDWKCRAG